MVPSFRRPEEGDDSQQRASQEHAVEVQNNQQDRRPSQHRTPDSQGGPRGESGGGSKDRNRNRRSGGGAGGGSRKGVYRFDDQMDHAICQGVTHRSPQSFPAIGRSELATMPPIEVARTGSSILFCNYQHDGPHLWPNGDEVS